MIEPKFKNAQEYELAQVLMQPIFIRLLDNIRKESELSNYDVSYEEINEPFPSYIVAIKKENKTEKNNVWELCFQVCFNNYSESTTQPVTTDKTLFEEDGQLNWQTLDEKAKTLVKSLFSSN
ncbi:hypothetical protein [Cyanobacterium aponinum]|uniref:Uncharacterized protein n=1 Tax=Cyanobacterium aponinum 0216 TaxID=2676140 RepID=A0A844GT39_9CHRO|nr:hypothetical protein [Cyanobacterium aponinum]MTF38211.1 hypothetical protein [Cyanobacterium aponinum 0216]